MQEDDFKIAYDPIEDNPKIKPLIKVAEKEAKAQLKAEGIQSRMGYCHMLWGRKQKILQEKYGIAWKTPGEMNPHIWFD